MKEKNRGRHGPAVNDYGDRLFKSWGKDVVVRQVFNTGIEVAAPIPGGWEVLAGASYEYINMLKRCGHKLDNLQKLLVEAA